MSFRLTFLFLCLLCSDLLPGQDLIDSVELEEVKIYGIPLKDFATGSKVRSVDSVVIEMYGSSTLADLLTKSSALYLKTYGAGMISTVSFRGTSASHTAVVWNGVNINSASLGQSDFSTFPVLASENVSIQYGGSSALYGSGAVGGTINLYSTPDWISGFTGEIQQRAGSFGRLYTGVEAKYGNGKIETQTKIFVRTAENDFPYNVKGIKGTKEVRQNNAALKQYGLVQDFYLRLASNQYLALNAWVNYLDREVQPSVSAPSSRDQQLDQNIRLVGNYHLNGKFGHLNPRVAYLYDVIEFNKSPSITHRYIAAIQHEYTFNKFLKINAGFDNTYIIADIKGYGKTVRENRSDAFALVKFSPWKKLTFAANLRQSFVSGFKAPISPSLGFEYNFFSMDEYKLYWKTNISRSYRIPTLNDRFWHPGGNPDLKSETGKNLETGLHLKMLEVGSKKWEVEATAYSNIVDDWIIWLPDSEGSYWTPGNLKKVHARGFEVNSSFSNSFGSFDYSVALDYAFTRSTNHNKEDKDYGKQLIYVPTHNGSLAMEGQVAKWLIRLNTTYTGSRFTTIDQLDPFWLIQIAVGKSLPLGKHLLTACVEVNNVFDEEYFNYESHAMPGRNYNLSLKYAFKNKPNKQ